MTDGVRPEVVHERIFTWNAGAGSWTSQGTRLFVTGVNPDERLVMIDGAGSYGVHVDRRGSALALSSGGGILPQNQFRYGPYGESSDPIGDLPSFGGQAFAYRYTGQRLNAWSRLYDYKARDYSTNLGRFLQPDPILDEGGHPNLYTYVRNNPVNLGDPDGTEAFNYSVYGRGPDLRSNPELARSLADFIPIVGDVKGAYEALREPTAINVLAAAAGMVPLFGDAAGKALKQVDDLGYVYRRTNIKDPSEKPYIGRASNTQRYRARQLEHKRKNPAATYNFEVLARAKPGAELRQAEQQQIDAHGGPTNRSNPNGGTSNKRNEMRACRAVSRNGCQ